MYLKSRTWPTADGINLCILRGGDSAPLRVGDVRLISTTGIAAGTLDERAALPAGLRAGSVSLGGSSTAGGSGEGTRRLFCLEVVGIEAGGAIGATKRSSRAFPLFLRALGARVGSFQGGLDG